MLPNSRWQRPELAFWCGAAAPLLDNNPHALELPESHPHDPPTPSARRQSAMSRHRDLPSPARNGSRSREVDTAIAYSVLAPFVIMGLCLAGIGDFEAAFLFALLPIVILSCAWTVGTRLGL